MSPALSVHVIGGSLAIVCGAVALAVRKGGRIHRASGGVFVAAMFAMAGAATLLALTLPDWANLPGGLFALYLVGTGWAALARNSCIGRLADQAGSVLGGGAAATALAARVSGQRERDGVDQRQGCPALSHRGLLGRLRDDVRPLDITAHRGVTKEADRPSHLAHVHGLIPWHRVVLPRPAAGYAGVDEGLASAVRPGPRASCRHGGLADPSDHGAELATDTLTSVASASRARNMSRGPVIAVTGSIKGDVRCIWTKPTKVMLKANVSLGSIFVIGPLPKSELDSRH